MVRVRVRDLNEYITCFLCKGYMVNATAISECMHKFCRGCIVKQFSSKSACPQCGIPVNPTEPTKTLKSDNQLQDLINKVVPGFAERERSARREFYTTRGQKPEEEEEEEEVADEKSVVEHEEVVPAVVSPAKKRVLYRRPAPAAAALLHVSVSLQHERNAAASSLRVKRYPSHVVRFPLDATLRQVKEYIRERLSFSVSPTPVFDDPRVQKSWQKSRDAAVRSAPEVDILLGDYLMTDTVTLGVLSKIKYGQQEHSVLSLTYRFRGTLSIPSARANPANEPSLYLRGSSRGKERTKKQVTRPIELRKIASMASPAPLSPRHSLLKRWAPKFNVNKAPVVRKSIIIQHSSKPPIEKSIILSGRRSVAAKAAAANAAKLQRAALNPGGG